jgi:hypothetical protein
MTGTADNRNMRERAPPLVAPSPLVTAKPVGPLRSLRRALRWVRAQLAAPTCCYPCEPIDRSNRGCSGDKVQSIYSFTRHGRSGRSIACLWDGCAGRFRVRPYNRMGWAGACRYVEVDAALRLGWLVDEKDQDGNTILHWAYRPTHTCTRMHSHACTRTHAHARTHTRSCTRSCMHAHARMHPHECAHAVIAVIQTHQVDVVVTAFRNRTASR